MWGGGGRNGALVAAYTTTVVVYAATSAPASAHAAKFSRHFFPAIFFSPDGAIFVCV